MIKIIAHRGFSNIEKENTMEAIFLALNTKYIDGVEIDVRLTKDNQLVVIHDKTINRTSNGIGYVKNMTYQQLKQYNFGDDNNYQIIPTLLEILSIYKNNKILIIEIKNDNRINLIIEAIYNILRKYPSNKIYIGSFNPNIILKMNKYQLPIKIGIFISNELSLKNIKLPIDFVGLHYSLIDQNLAEELLDRNVEIMLWTIDDEETLKYIKEVSSLYYKKLYIITNKPNLIYTLENKK